MEELDEEKASMFLLVVLEGMDSFLWKSLFRYPLEQKEGNRFFLIDWIQRIVNKFNNRKTNRLIGEVWNTNDFSVEMLLREWLDSGNSSGKKVLKEKYKSIKNSYEYDVKTKSDRILSCSLLDELGNVVYKTKYYGVRIEKIYFNKLNNFTDAEETSIRFIMSFEREEY